jgi:Heterokaryon incompatibility protein (HET)
MRLLNTTTLQIETFQTSRPSTKDGQLIKYAALSHTWDEEELSLQDLQNLSKAKRMKGFEKVKNAAQEASNNKFEYIWIDTCCIDKTSSSELSEAINCE